VNYLAHIHLAGQCPEQMIGGLLGDFVKGPLRGDYPPAIEAGILLHRKIDVFTDHLPPVRTAIARFEPPYRRFGGILLDLCYDHFLADNWSRYHHRPLTDFCQDFYRDLSAYAEILPDGAKRFSEVALRVNWLENYAQFQNLEYMLERIGQRFKTPVPLHRAFPELQRDYRLLSNEFHQIFPLLIEFTETQRLK